jgi:hypothetical protein
MGLTPYDVQTNYNSSSKEKIKVSKSKKVLLRTRDYNDTEPIISIKQYRKLAKDYKSTDEDILQRIDYLTIYSRKIIKRELNTYEAEN